MLSDSVNKIKSCALYNSLANQTRGEHDISFDRVTWQNNDGPKMRSVQAFGIVGKT